MLVLASPGPSTQAGGNPYLRLLYSAVADSDTGSPLRVMDFQRKMLLQHPDVIHVHWPYYLVRWNRRAQAVLDMVKVLTLLSLAKRRGAALVWTVHDLEPHEVTRPRMWAWFERQFVRRVDMLILLSSGSRQQIVGRHPSLTERPYRVVPHGHFRDEYEPSPAQHEARTELGLPDRPTILAFGQIRPYKRTVELCKGMAALPAQDRRAQLLVAGEARASALREQLESIHDPDIRLMLSVVPHEQVPVVFGACDVVLLPYSTQSTLNSSVALLALSFGLPVVMVDTAAGRDLQALLGPEWVTLTSEALPELLQAAQARAQARPDGPPDLSSLNWSGLGQLMASAYVDAGLQRV
jgi:beta-1,4-mannosyltransferase